MGPHSTAGKAWSVVFYPGSVRKEKRKNSIVQVTVSTTAEKPTAMAVHGQKSAKQSSLEGPSVSPCINA